MRNQSTRAALVLAEVAIAALAVFFHLSLRRRVADAFDAFGTEVPPLTRLALSGWLMPVALGLSAALTAVALAAPMRRARSIRTLQLAVTVLATVVVFAVLAALVPIFRP